MVRASSTKKPVTRTTSNHPPAQAPTPYIVNQQPQQSLTALPVRPSPPMPTARSEKGKEKETVPREPAKLKEVAKSQGLRKKFFGKRL